MNPQSARSGHQPPISVLVPTAPAPRSPQELYLDLMKRILTRTLIARARERHAVQPGGGFRRAIHGAVRTVLDPLNLELVRLRLASANDYIESDHAAYKRVEDAETMVGMRQLDNMQACITSAIENDVPGDLLEAGVWRGGMTILMRAVLKAFGDTSRKVWLADSFEGLPPSDTRVDPFGWSAGDMAVSMEQVRDNFARYGLLDDQVSFLKGYFNETLPGAAIPTLSILRVDADLYQSTMDVLTNLYPKLSPGGFAIFDDYLNLRDCRRAVDEYRQQQGIVEPIEPIDSRAVFWKKTGSWHQ
jgi:O-methyltransferase